MTGKHRKKIISIAVSILVALNIWRWWPESPTQSVDAGPVTVGAFSVENFEVKASPVDSLPPLSRDIFFPKKIEVVKTGAAKRKVTAPQAIQPEQTKTPEEAARDDAQAEFSQIQCVGISMRKDRAHAYLINAGEPSLVSKGDKVGNRFVVENIESDGVTLRDSDTGFSGLIEVSGKK